MRSQALLIGALHITLASGLLRSLQPHMFQTCFSTNDCCMQEYLKFNLPDVLSLNARSVVGQVIAMDFACYDPYAPLKSVLADPNNLIPSYGSRETTILVIDGYRMQCERMFHVIFIVKVLIQGEILTRGYCMFKSPELEEQYVPNRRPNTYNRLAQFKALPQPFNEKIELDLLLYSGHVREHMRVKIAEWRRIADEEMTNLRMSSDPRRNRMAALASTSAADTYVFSLRLTRLD